MKQLNVTISRALFAKLKMESAIKDVTLKSYILSILEQREKCLEGSND